MYSCLSGGYCARLLSFGMILRTLVSRVDSVFLSSLGKIPCTLVSWVDTVLLSSLGKVLDVLLLSLGWILYSCSLSERYYMNSCSLSVDIALFSSLGWISYSCRLLGRYCVLLLPTHSLPLPGSCPLSGKCYTLVFFRTVVISWDYTLVLFRLDIRLMRILCFNT